MGIKGAAATPFLLKKVHSLSGGASVKSNIQLIKRNAEVGAKLAVALKEKERTKQNNENKFFSMYSNHAEKAAAVDKGESGGRKNKVIVIGGSAVDFEVSVTDGKLELYQSCKGVWRTTYGGVGRNIA